MTAYNILFDNAVMKAELDRLIDHFQRDEPVVSHIWIAIRHPGVAEGKWTFDHIDAFLTLFSEDGDTNDADVYTVWSPKPDVSPQNGHVSVIGNASALKDTTAINIVDFIIHCVTDEPLFRKHKGVICALVAFPWRMVIEEAPETRDKIWNALACLLALHRVNMHDPDEQAQEYHQVMTNLAEGKLEPSRIQMFLTFKGDTGGTAWDSKRLLTCLNEMSHKDESSNLVIGWTAVPTRDTLPNSEGVSAINLTDFIWLCCQHKEVIYGDMAVVVVMLILYPFRKAVGEDYHEWVQRTMGLLKDIHGVGQQHTPH